MDPGEDTFALDGVTLGADVDLGQGWSVKATLVGGQLAKNLNLSSGETGNLALSEAQLVWTGDKETLRFGRKNTSLGMESLDGTQDITASRGLLYNFADPYGQVGLSWHHAFTPVWSADLWIFNGEDRIQDNNHSKTWGLGLTYNIYSGGLRQAKVREAVWSKAEAQEQYRRLSIAVSSDVRQALADLVEGVLAQELHARLPRRRPQLDFARLLLELSSDIRRQVGVLLNRFGEPVSVIVGSERGLMIPELDRYPLGRRLLRGIRLIHTHLKNEPLTDDDIRACVAYAADRERHACIVLGPHAAPV